MIASAKSNEMICFQLRNNLYDTLSPVLQLAINKVSYKIEKRLLAANRGKSEVISNSILPDLFNLRIKALHWLMNKADFDYLQAIEQVFPTVEHWKSHKNMEQLAENMLFALRCNQRVAQALSEAGGFYSEQVAKQSQKITHITYEQFISALHIALDTTTAQKITQLTHASLQIEFVMLASDIINEKLSDLSDKIINDLAFLAADSGQEYMAIALDLGIIKRRSKPTMLNLKHSPDPSDIAEEHRIANLDLEASTDLY